MNMTHPTADSSSGVPKEAALSELCWSGLSGRREEPHVQRTVCVGGLHGV